MLATLIHRVRLYLLNRQIVKYDNHIAHLKEQQLIIIRSVFEIQSAQLNRRADASLIRQMLDVPTSE